MHSDLPLLSVRDLTVRFSGIVALEGVSFDVEQGQIVGLIGPNGAGKTTLFNCLSRLYAPQRGDIAFAGKSIFALPRYRIAGLGIGRTFQNLALFPHMAVVENVMVGLHSRTRSGYLGNALRLPSVSAEERAARQSALEMLEFLGLRPVADHLAAGLPYGTLMRIELARALVAKPRLLLLDEPAGGLNHEELSGLARLICDIRDRHNVTVLLIEHRMDLVMQISTKVVVLNFGRKIAEGAPAEVQNNAEVIHAYLGSV